MRNVRTAVLCAVVCSVIVIAWLHQAQSPQRKHINRVVELLAADQPVYYTGSHSGTSGTFEQGKADAQTYADYLSYDMEHAPFDVRGLSEYMKGLAAGGPTKSGHKTPAVIVNVPVNGTDERPSAPTPGCSIRCWPPACTAFLPLPTRRVRSGRSSKRFGCPFTSRPWAKG